MPKRCSIRSAAGLSLAILLALNLIGCARPALFTPLYFGPWKTYLFDEGRTNFIDEELNPPLGLRWSRRISDISDVLLKPGESSSPILYDGSLYVGSREKGFYSIAIANGSVLWRWKGDEPIDASPTVNERMVCFSSGRAILHCLDRKNGSELWEFQARSEILSAPLIVGGTLYFTTSANRLYALTSDTGEKLWTFTRHSERMVSTRFYSSPATTQDKLYVLFSDGYLICMERESGKEIWNRQVLKDTAFETIYPARRTPTIFDGHVYVIDDKGAVLMLDAETGKGRAKFDTKKAVDFVVRHDRIIIAGEDKAVSFKLSDGSLLWKRTMEKGKPTSIFGAGKHVFILSNREIVPLGLTWMGHTAGYIQALTIEKGTVVWIKRLNASVSASAAAVKNHVALLTDRGILQVFMSK